MPLKKEKADELKSLIDKLATPTPHLSEDEATKLKSTIDEITEKEEEVEA